MDIREQLNQKTREIQTSCKDCIFAEYNNNTQTGCKFNRIEQFKNNGTKIVEAYDDDKEFFVIDRFCNYCRNDQWMKDNVNGQTAEQVVKNEAKIQVDVLVYIHAGNYIQSIQQTIDSLNQQFMLPKSITLVNNNSTIKNHDLVLLMRNQTNQYSWRVEQIVEENCKKLRAIDLSVKKCKGTYYIVIDAGSILRENFIYQINQMINEQLLKISLIIGNGHSPSVTQTRLHKILAGNKGSKTVIEKIKELAEEQNLEHMIKDWSEICS